MAKLVLSKSGLQKQRENMRLYERVLPSLELKRMQLTAELKRTREQLAEAEAKIEARLQRISEELPMLADEEMDLSRLIEIETIEIEQENIVGVKVPKLVGVKSHTRPYSLLARPQWIDRLTEQLKEMVTQKALLKITFDRVRLLEQAARKVTQRTNLFDKILIPQAKENIRKIQIHLADADRAAVVRSKITKGIRRKQAMGLGEVGP